MEKRSRSNESRSKTMKEIATKALNSTKAAIADLTKSLQGIGETITPE
jgi:hypothetical protein